jgi:hypothetical protein
MTKKIKESFVNLSRGLCLTDHYHYKTRQMKTCWFYKVKLDFVDIFRPVRHSEEERE